jgi:hypothetical protein
MTNAKRYLELCEQIKKLEKEKDQLRKAILGVMGDSTAILLDGVILTTKEQSRSSIDREKLTLKMGDQFVNEFLNVTTFKVLSAQAANGGN